MDISCFLSEKGRFTVLSGMWTLFSGFQGKFYRHDLHSQLDGYSHSPAPDEETEPQKSLVGCQFINKYEYSPTPYQSSGLPSVRPQETG